jgi:hypothetical protein
MTRDRYSFIAVASAAIPFFGIAAFAVACGAGASSTPTCAAGQVSVDGACLAEAQGSMRLAYFYSFSNRRGLQTVEIGETFEILNKRGSSDACGKAKSRATCEINRAGQVRAVNDDCAVGRVDGEWAASGCSVADAKNDYDDKVQRVSCCIVDAKAMERPDDSHCACKPWAEVSSFSVKGKCEDGADCAKKLELTDQCADPEEVGQPWCFQAAACPDASYDHERKQWWRRCR